MEIVGNGWRLALSKEIIEVRQSPREAIDPKWRFTDATGHEHVGEDYEATTEWVRTGTYWCDQCRDEHDEGEYRCRECGEVIKLGTHWVPEEVDYLPGLLSAKLTVYHEGGERVYWARPDELTDFVVVRTSEGKYEPPAEWLERVTSRQPDSEALVFSRG